MGYLAVVANNAQDLDQRVTHTLIQQIDSGSLSVSLIPQGLLDQLTFLTATIREDDRTGENVDEANLTDFQRQERKRARLDTETQIEWMQRMKDSGILPQNETLTEWTAEERKEYAKYVEDDEREERRLIFRILDGQHRTKYGYKAVLGPARHTIGQELQEQQMASNIRDISDDTKMRAFKKKVLRHDGDNMRPSPTDDLPSAL